jgi:hypothetical protein
MSHVPLNLVTQSRDLYSVGHPHTKKPQLENGEAIPFIHWIELEGPKGELVQVQVLFNDGAMVSAKCISIFKKSNIDCIIGVHQTDTYKWRMGAL